jgi:site-specific DNA recombinase
MVWNRRASKKGGRHNPPEAWIWSPQPTHQPIVSRELFAAAQQVAPQRRGSRSGAGLNRHPQTRRSYPLRSLVTCELCGRRMRGKLRRKARREASAGRRPPIGCPSIPPASWSAETCCCAASWSSSRCACLVPNGGLCSPWISPTWRVARSRRGRRGSKRSSEPLLGNVNVKWPHLADLQGRQVRLVRTLEERDDPGGGLFEQIARRLGELDREQQTKLAELRAVVAERPDADAQAVDLLELLPLLTSDRLATAPEPLLRALFERFQLQVRYHQPLNRATVRVALSDDSLDGLLASVEDLEGGAPRQDPAVPSPWRTACRRTAGTPAHPPATGR